MPWEVEQKYPLPDPDPILARLSALGAAWDAEIEQVDAYFQHPARDFAKTDEALRIRRVGERNRITFKGPKTDRATKTRREIELPLGDGDQQAEGWHALLQALGFAPAAVVRKLRRPGRLTWQDAQVTLALDQVAQLGSFLELELTADDAGLDLARQRIMELARHLGLSNQERRSYLELLLDQER